MNNLRARLRSWWGVPWRQAMAAAIVMYIIKAALKITVGSHIHSPMISGDGFHNLADLLVSSVIIIIVLESRRPCSTQYPLGKKNLEYFAKGGIGLGLIGLSAVFAFKSLIGIVHYLPNTDHAIRTHCPFPLPEFEALVMDPSNLATLIGITAGSVVLSVLVGRFQIHAGVASKDEAIESDGRETVSDGIIESVALVGILSEYFFHAPWLEYPLGLLVAGLILHTGWELGSDAWGVLLQRSLDPEHNDNIRRLTMRVAGVVDVVQLSTYRVGSTAICNIKVATRAAAAKHAHMRYGIEQAIDSYARSKEFRGSHLTIEFVAPPANFHRIVLALVKRNGTSIIAPTLKASTHLLVCDIKDGQVARSTRIDTPNDPVNLLISKHVDAIYTYAPHDEETALLEAKGIRLLPAASHLPKALGASRQSM